MFLNHTAALTKRNIVGKHKVKNIWPISQNLCCCVMHLLLLYWTSLRLSLNFTLIVSTCQNASLYQQIKLLWGTWFISARKLSRFWTKCWVVNRHKKLFGIPKFFRWGWRRYNRSYSGAFQRKTTPFQNSTVQSTLEWNMHLSKTIQFATQFKQFSKRCVATKRWV